MAKLAGHVVVTGNPKDGFDIVGPFKTGYEAIEYATDNCDSVDWWVLPLDAPEQPKKGRR